MNANVEFDEIRPYHDEELPQVYEELIADAARCRQTSRRRIPISPIIATLFSIPVSCPFFW